MKLLSKRQECKVKTSSQQLEESICNMHTENEFVFISYKNTYLYI